MNIFYENNILFIIFFNFIIKILNFYFEVKIDLMKFIIFLILFFTFILSTLSQKKAKIIYNNFTETYTIEANKSLELEIIKDKTFIEIDLYPISGKPKLFKYFCKSYNCTVDKSNYLQLHYQNLLQDTIRVGKQYITYIFPEEVPSQEIEDTLLVVSYCFGEAKCEFYLSGKKKTNSIILNPNLKLFAGQMGLENNYKITQINKDIEIKVTFIYGSGNIKTSNNNQIILKGNSLIISDYLEKENSILLSSPSNLYFFEYKILENENDSNYEIIYNNLVVSEEIQENIIKTINFIKEDFDISEEENSKTLISIKAQNCELTIKNTTDNKEINTSFYSEINYQKNVNFTISINKENKTFGNNFCLYQIYSMDLNKEPYILLSENVPMTLQFDNFNSFTAQMAITYIPKLSFSYILKVEPEENSIYEIFISIQTKRFKYTIIYKKDIQLKNHIQKYCEPSMICIINALIINKKNDTNSKITLNFKAFSKTPFFVSKNILMTETFKENLYLYTDINEKDNIEFFPLLSYYWGKIKASIIVKKDFEKQSSYPITFIETDLNLNEESNSLIISNNNKCIEGCFVFFNFVSFDIKSIIKGIFYFRSFNNYIKIKENEDVVGFINDDSIIIYKLNIIYDIKRFIFNIQTKGVKFCINYNNSDNKFIFPNGLENFEYKLEEGSFLNQEITVKIQRYLDGKFIFKIIPQFTKNENIFPISEFRKISCEKNQLNNKQCYFYFHSINNILGNVILSVSEEKNLTEKILGYSFLKLENNDQSLKNILENITDYNYIENISTYIPYLSYISDEENWIFFVKVTLLNTYLNNPIRLYLGKVIPDIEDIEINLNQEITLSIVPEENEKNINIQNLMKNNNNSDYKYQIVSRFGFGKLISDSIQKILNGIFFFNPKMKEKKFKISSFNTQIFLFTIILTKENNMSIFDNITFGYQNTFFLEKYIFPYKFIIDKEDINSFTINFKIKNPNFSDNLNLNLSYFNYSSYLCEKNKDNNINILSKLNIDIFELENILIISSLQNNISSPKGNYIMIELNKSEKSSELFNKLSSIEFNIISYSNDKNYIYFPKGSYYYGVMNNENNKTELLLYDLKAFEFATCSENLFNLTFKFKNNTKYIYNKDTKNELFGKYLYQSENKETDIYLEITNLNQTNELNYYTLKSGIEKNDFIFLKGQDVNVSYLNGKLELKYSNIEKKKEKFNFNEKYFLRINSSSLLSNHSICYQHKYSIQKIENFQNYKSNFEANKLIGSSIVAFFYDNNIEEMLISYNINEYHLEEKIFIYVFIIIFCLFALIVLGFFYYLFSKVKEMEQNSEELEEISNLKGTDVSSSFISEISFNINNLNNPKVNASDL